MNIKDVEIGVPFYTVLALGESSFMEKYTPTSKPYETQLAEHYSAIFVNVKQDIDGRLYDTDMSLQDAGIIPNEYNGHQSFLSEKVAKHHLKLVKKFPSSLGHNTYNI